MENVGRNTLAQKVAAQPRSVLAHLNLYEGLALAYEQLAGKESASSNPKAKEIAKTYSETYLSIVGIEPSDRVEFRETLEKQIADDVEKK